MCLVWYYGIIDLAFYPINKSVKKLYKFYPPLFKIEKKNVNIHLVLYYIIFCLCCLQLLWLGLYTYKVLESGE